MEALFFWLFAFGLVGFALGVVLFRNPVTSAVCLVVAFLFLAALFVTLEAFFVAMVQIIVYAGAVMVLFLFIIMLLDIREEARRPVPWMRLGVMGLLVASFGGLFAGVLSAQPQGKRILAWGAETASGAGDLGRLLFDRYVLPFEITGVLLLVATVGVVLLSKREARK